MSGIGWNPYMSYAAYARTPITVRAAQPAAQPGVPVEPVSPARPVQTDQGASRPIARQLPVVWSGADPAEMAVRMRMKPYEDPAQPADAARAMEAEPKPDAERTESPRETMEEAECQTCKERKYQDGSDDPGVSFKTPTNIAPEQAAAKVRGHEMEHVTREQAKAAREDRKVVSQTVTMHTAICPECGRVYVSGGTTRTATVAADRGRQLYQQPEKEAAGAQFAATA